MGDRKVQTPEIATDREIEIARSIYENDDIEIDNGAAVSRSPEDEGVWVAAWVWVSNQELHDNDDESSRNYRESRQRLHGDAYVAGGSRVGR
jgi:hypothetical protein